MRRNKNNEILKYPRPREGSQELTDAPLTDHAMDSVYRRSISKEQIQRTIDNGREVYARHAVIYFVGEKEIKEDRSMEDCRGIHVVCGPDNGVVITAYRNDDLHQVKYTLGHKPRNGGIRRRFRR